MAQLERIPQIFLFHLARRIVNRLPMPVVIVLAVAVIVALLFMPQIQAVLGL